MTENWAMMQCSVPPSLGLRDNAVQRPLSGGQGLVQYSLLHPWGQCNAAFPPNPWGSWDDGAEPLIPGDQRTMQCSRPTPGDQRMMQPLAITGDDDAVSSHPWG